jgi:hypothetical protein
MRQVLDDLATTHLKVLVRDRDIEVDLKTVTDVLERKDMPDGVRKALGA